ncbi:MAG TPA: NUDIX hydrolase [Allocoleopsis sp.]
MARDPIMTWYFVVVVVHWNNKYLLIQEAKHGQTWYLPSGRVEKGESFVDAAIRETLEESSILIIPEGILKIEHSSSQSGYARMRIIYKARPQNDNSTPKNIPDNESLKAEWVSLNDLANYSLRGDDVTNLLNYVDQGAEVYPLDLIKLEGLPFI